MNGNDLVERLNHCHLVLYGHKHNPSQLEAIADNLRNQYNERQRRYRLLQSKWTQNEVRNLIENINEFKRVKPDQQDNKNRLIDKVCEIALSADFSFPEQLEMDIGNTLQYLLRSGSSTENKEWSEIRINKRTKRTKEYKHYL